MAPESSLIHGPQQPALWNTSLGRLIDDQGARFSDRPAVIVPWQNARFSYRQLCEQSKVVATALLQTGLRHGDCVGVMGGNRHEYVEAFLGAARIGCPVVVLNNTYTPKELGTAVGQSSCKLVFIATHIGSRSLGDHIALLRGKEQRNPILPDLERVVCFGSQQTVGAGVNIENYDTFLSRATPTDDGILEHAQNAVGPEDVLNLQFTSGTTGSPKAAMLTHNNIVNNARFVGRAMHLTPDDIICCPPPLFHCFGLVMGFLASFCHGSSIVFASDSFHAPSVVDTVVDLDATVLLGVPTMFVAELEVMAKTGQKPRRLRTGLASGSSVSQALMNELRAKMGVDKMLIAYGMTETSPVTFISDMEDSDEKRTTTVGRPMPHTAAKVISRKGETLPRGHRGELCTSGYALQKGYWKNPAKTEEVMKRDADGRLWMYTGDEAMIDDEGFALITGRIKDIIIRGGENIFPREIEERLVAHTAITEASVVGIRNSRYGEVVGCFLRGIPGQPRLSTPEVQQWVGDMLGRHKTPQHVFWLGDPLVGEDFPKTGSGKHQKHLLRDIGDRIVRREQGAKL